MPYVPVANAVEVAVHGQCGGAPTTNVFNVRSGMAAPDQAEVGLAVADVADAFRTHLLPNLSTDFTLTHFVGRDLSSQTGPVVEVVDVTNGGHAGTSLPPAVAAVVSWKTAQRGRSFRGRTYLPGIPEAVVTAGGLLGEAWQADVAADVAAFITALVGEGHRLIIVSRYSGVDGGGNPIPRAAGVITNVTTGLVREYVKSQRRRNQLG